MAMAQFTLIPAIDLSEGKCVRLTRGAFADKTIYSERPAAIAKQWESKGAQWLHIVDLDGARAGEPRNAGAIRKILQTVSIPAQVAGGLRRVENVEAALGAGAARVVLGTGALLDPAFLDECINRFDDAVVVSIDARGDRVALSGWTQMSMLEPTQLARELEQRRCPRLIFTDINRDGTLSGPNLEALSSIAAAVRTPVIASGGVSSLADIRALAALAPLGVEGVILGKSLYEGKVDLIKALEALGAG